jgi:hypothetical protein
MAITSPQESKKTAKYVREILTIVFLTNIAAVMFLLTRFGQAIGWITGSVGSGLNFYWLYHKTKKGITLADQGANLHSFKGFYLRYLFLAIYSVIVVVVLKPDIVTFGAGLVSVQITIILHYFYRLLRPEKSEDEAVSQDEETKSD